MKLRHLLLPALLATAFLSGGAVAQDPIIGYDKDDADMNAAIDEARATLPLFLDEAFNEDGESWDEALVKVAFPTVDGGGMDVEHIWVAPFAEREGGGFTGLLANEPMAMGDLTVGDQVDFTADMISDWHMTAPSGRFWGSFTSRVMHAQGAFGDTPFEMIFEPEPVPADWR